MKASTTFRTLHVFKYSKKLVCSKKKFVCVCKYRLNIERRSSNTLALSNIRKLGFFFANLSTKFSYSIYFQTVLIPDCFWALIFALRRRVRWCWKFPQNVSVSANMLNHYNFFWPYLCCNWTIYDCNSFSLTSPPEDCRHIKQLVCNFMFASREN